MTEQNSLDTSQKDILNVARVFDLDPENAAELADVEIEEAEEYYEITDRKPSSVNMLGGQQDRKKRLESYLFEFRDVEEAARSAEKNTDSVKFRLMLEAGGIYSGPEGWRRDEDLSIEVNEGEILTATKGYESTPVDPRAALYQFMNENDGATLQEMASFLHEEVDFWRGNPSGSWKKNELEELLEEEAQAYSERNLWYEIEPGAGETSYATGLDLYKVSEGFNPLATVDESEKTLIEEKVRRWNSDYDMVEIYDPAEELE